ncbi:MAG TPA: FecR domain-containing protein, partial [Kofleriaceae bacterium]|nr:FecR domain-containing protein [Kofleriaceae bacterium]
MRRSAALLAAACLVVGVGCSKDESKADESKSAPSSGAPASGSAEAKGEESKTAGDVAEPAAGGAVDPAALAEKVGVEPGAFEYGPEDGAAAVVASAQGKVEIRRVGTETWEETKAEAQLHEGDQVRAAEGGLVTLTLVDETSIEVAEESAVAIGSRSATADPASSAAVLYGVARFTVNERAPGEGPFLVFTPGGVVATKGTVYTVGVAASGVSRVGVENGEVEVAGAAKLTSPVLVPAGSIVVVQAGGELDAVGPAGDADWGAWRDEAESSIEAKATAQFHAQRAEALEAELEAAYAELEVQTAAAAEAEAAVEAAEKANDTAAYAAAAPEMGGAVDASFAMSLRLQYLSNAMLGHAYVADQLYVRHPDVVAVIEPARPRLAAAVLWHKKYHAVSDVHVAPMRDYYYVHHPVGRVRAKLVAYP